MRVTMADIRPKILSACTTAAERDLIGDLLQRRTPPDYVWIPYVAFALDPHTPHDAVVTTAASFAAAELAALLLDDIIDDDLGSGDVKQHILGIAIAATIAVKLVADTPDLTRLIADYLADAFENQYRQWHGASAVSADYWTEAKARVLPYYTYPFMLGAVVANCSDLRREMSALGAAFSHISIIHDDLQDLFEEADWESQQNLVIQYALAQETDVDWEVLRRTGAIDYACNLWLDAVLHFDALWQHSSIAAGTEIARHWRDYLTNAMPGLVYLSADVDTAKLEAVTARMAQL